MPWFRVEIRNKDGTVKEIAVEAPHFLAVSVWTPGTVAAKEITEEEARTLPKED